MTGLMAAVYRALLPLPCALSRAWPQSAQPLPAVSFLLSDWQAGDAGPDRVHIRLSLRAALPEETDALSEQAAAALMPLGLRLLSARDEAEADTGVFLKTMAFEGLAMGGSFLAPALEVNSGAAWVQAAGLTSARFEPARRAFRDIRALSDAAARYFPGEESPPALRLGFLPVPGDAGQAAIRAAFAAGEVLEWRLQGGACARQERGLVTELEDSALGLACRIMTIN